MRVILKLRNAIDVAADVASRYLAFIFVCQRMVSACIYHERSDSFNSGKSTFSDTTVLSSGKMGSNLLRAQRMKGHTIKDNKITLKI